VTVPAEWFREWFGEAYLSLYPHRDEEEAARGVHLFLGHAGLEKGARVLDLACGAGRHLDRLRAAGLAATGVDLSRPLLADAAARPGVIGRLVRGDMRELPFRDAAFEGLVNFFTSFGYFLTPEEDVRVITEMRRVLRHGHPFMVDYLNAARVTARLEPETVSERGGRRVRQTRWVEGDHVFKKIEILDDGNGEPDVYHERVRLYRPETLEALLDRHGLSVARRCGSYDGADFGPESPRLILLGEAT